MEPLSVLLSNEILMSFETTTTKNLCSLSLVCSQHVITCSLLLLNQPVWGAQGLLGFLFFSVEFEVLPTPSGSSLSLTSRMFLSRREEEDASLDPCRCMSMVLGALCFAPQDASAPHSARWPGHIYSSSFLDVSVVPPLGLSVL